KYIKAISPPSAEFLRGREVEQHAPERALQVDLGIVAPLAPIDQRQAAGPDDRTVIDPVLHAGAVLPAAFDTQVGQRLAEGDQVAVALDDPGPVLEPARRDGVLADRNRLGLVANLALRAIEH